MDSSSFAFRYPVDKKNIGTLPESFVFNLLAFARAADDCLEIMYNAVYAIDEQTEVTIENLDEISDRS